MLNQVRIIRQRVGRSCIGLLRVPSRRPTGFGDENGYISDVEILHGEVSSVDHGVEEVGVVKKSVGVEHLFGEREGFEEGVFERDEVSVLHEDVVRVEVEH